MSTPAPSRAWWKEGVCYQVWPASFKDSNDDGVGDIPGIISKLDYLKDLGVDFIWLSPCYDSPRHDMGYDIRNFEDVGAEFGTMKDMDALIKGLHDRGMKLMLDLVINHTSDEHAWFKESCKSKDNPCSDYYIWRDPKYIDGKRIEPNNWASVFGGSAWKYVESRDQYYFHFFLDSQPDVNWNHTPARHALYKTAITFWLDRGIDGFRVDACGLYDKNTAFPDAEIKDPKNLYHLPDIEKDLCNGPQMHPWLQEQRKLALEPHGDVPLVGELGFTDEDELIKYLDSKNRELDCRFDFSVVAPDDPVFANPDKERDYTFKLSRFRNGWTRSQRLYTSHNLWPTVFIENHDGPRSITKFGSHDPSLREQSGKLLAMLLATLTGTLFIYQGQEFGMSNIPPDWPLSDLKDVWWKNMFQECERKYPGDEAQLEKTKVAFQSDGRDHARTPVQWSSEGTSAGFMSGDCEMKPWMRVNDNFREGVNAAEQVGREGSLFEFWKRCLEVRRGDKEVFVYGRTVFLDVKNEKVLYFTKSLDVDKGFPKVLVALNFSDDSVAFEMPKEVEYVELGKVLLSNTDASDAKTLSPREGRAYELA